MPRKSHKRDLDRFLHHLAATGNFALAAERTGKAKSGLYTRRARDPDFAARCEIAVATFRSSPERGGGAKRAACPGDRRALEPKLGGGATYAKPLLTESGTLTLSPPDRRRPVQLRRSPAGRLTDAGLAAFLRVLAATANVRFAAASVGVAHSSIYRRRRMDANFAEEMRLALLTGYDRVEAALLQTAFQTFDGDLDEDSKTRSSRAQSRGAPDFHSGEPQITGPMTVDQAIMLLWHHRRTCRMGWQHRNHPVRPRTQEENQRLLAGIGRKIKAMFGDRRTPK